VLALRLAFAILLYLFLFRLVGVLRRDLRRSARQPVPSEVLPPRVEGRLVVLSAGSAKLEGGQTFPLAPVTVIGRAPGSQVRLNDAMVSAEHARLRRRNGRWFVEDLGSTNGTLLNQQPVQGERPIDYGDMITIGDVRLKLAR
jgi:hypothetical protein